MARRSLGPDCWECGRPFLWSATWQNVETPRGVALHRPVCESCARPTRQPRQECQVCGLGVIYSDGRKVPFVACCWEHVTVARSRAPLPKPRACEHCGDPFTPKRRSNARFCTRACSQRARRARERQEVVGMLEAHGLDPSLVFPPTSRRGRAELDPAAVGGSELRQAIGRYLASM